MLVTLSFYQLTSFRAKCIPRNAGWVLGWRVEYLTPEFRRNFQKTDKPFALPGWSKKHLHHTKAFPPLLFFSPSPNPGEQQGHSVQNKTDQKTNDFLIHHQTHGRKKKIQRQSSTEFNCELFPNQRKIWKAIFSSKIYSVSIYSYAFRYACPPCWKDIQQSMAPHPTHPSQLPLLLHIFSLINSAPLGLWGKLNNSLSQDKP